MSPGGLKQIMLDFGGVLVPINHSLIAACLVATDDMQKNANSWIVHYCILSHRGSMPTTCTCGLLGDGSD